MAAGLFAASAGLAISEAVTSAEAADDEIKDAKRSAAVKKAEIERQKRRDVANMAIKTVGVQGPGLTNIVVNDANTAISKTLLDLSSFTRKKEAQKTSAILGGGFQAAGGLAMAHGALQKSARRPADEQDFLHRVFRGFRSK